MTDAFDVSSLKSKSQLILRENFQSHFKICKFTHCLDGRFVILLRTGRRNSNMASKTKQVESNQLKKFMLNPDK